MKTFICIISLALCICLFTYLQGIDGSTVHERDRTAVRKLLLEESKEKEVKTINATTNNCAISDVVVEQGAAGTLPNGIPWYLVEILNVSPKNTTVMDVHIKCGWFASYDLVDPYIFQRLAYDDCLVNNGRPILAGQAIGFSYSNTYPYPMTVSVVTCH